MALINGNDYDHIDFTKNGVTTRHMLKDTLSRQMSGDLVKVQNEEPTSEGTKIWIKPSGDSEVQVPTYEEFEELSDKINDADATIESLAVGDHPTVSVTEVDGHKRFSFGIPASNGIASITKTATDGVIDTYTIAMTDGTSTSFSVNNSDITPESMVEAITTALQDYARIDGYYPDMTVGNAEQLNSSKFVENSEPYTFRTSGGSSDIGNREYLDAVVGGTVAWNQMVRDEASTNETDFAPIVTVDDAVEDAAGVKVKIEPVQDLHGYDHPWPAGGGKNKFPVAEWFTAYDVSQNNLIVGDVSVFLKAGAYSLSFEYYVDGATSVNSFWRTYSEEVTSVVVSKQIEYGTLGLINNVTSWTQKTVSFTTTQDGWFAIDNAQLRGGVHYRNIQLEAGSATDFAPYSNICPITGWDGVQVWDDPKYGGLIEWNQRASGKRPYTQNSISSAFSDGVYTLSGTPSGSYTANIESVNIFNGHKYFQLLTIVKNPNNLSFVVGSLNGGIINVNVGTTSIIAECSTTRSVTVGVSSLRTGVSVDGIKFKYILCDLTQMFGEGNEPATVEEFKALFPADYYPYNAGEITTVSAVNGDTYRHYSIALPSEAGTVYGGELSVTTGELVVTHVGIPVDGTPNQWISGYTEGTDGNADWLNARLTTFSGDNLPSGYYNPSSDYFRCSFLPYKYANADGTAHFYKSTNFNLFLPKTTFPDVATVVSWLNANPQSLWIKLKTPTTYQLTPTQISTLLGENNIWADAGQTALTYTGTDEHLTLESGKKYLSRISGTDSMLLGSGQEIAAAKGTDNVFDLTQMFGTAVADYVYGQGAGFFRKWFPNAVYPYNAGELRHVEGLQSHDMVGFNQWDEEWEVRGGTNYRRLGSKNKIPILPGTRYYFSAPNNPSYGIKFYQKDGITQTGVTRYNKGDITSPDDAYYMSFDMDDSYGFVYKHDICISLLHNGSRKGEYEPYEKHSYPLDSTVVLRGIPKVGANGVYWDGDRYLPDGTVERRYGVVDMGTQVWGKNTFNGIGYFVTNNILSDLKKPESSIDDNNFLCTKYPLVKTPGVSTAFIDKTFFVYTSGYIYVRDDSFTDLASFRAAMSGVYLIYELATPTTEAAQSYHSTQWVSDWGTEEFVSTGLVPVGHETRYPANLRDKLQHLPDAASGNGSYLITQTDGQMVLTPFPAPPSTAGNYVLKATVTGGVATYTWEVAT